MLFKGGADSTVFDVKTIVRKALVYTYTLLPRLSRYVLDGRYNIDNNGVENAIRPLAIERTTSSAATTMQRSEQPSYTHSSAAVRHMMLMSDRGWRIHSEESLQKRALTSYYLATGRYYPLMAGNNQLLPTTTATTGYLSNGG